MKKPNILFLFSDQQRWDTVSCYHQPLGTTFPLTPNLDRLASQGMRFEYAFTCQPVCGPARAALQTGQYPSQVGCPTNHTMPPAEAMVLAPTLRKAGYEVGYIGKWHLASFGPRGGKDDFHDRPVPPERRGGYEEYWLASDVLECTSHSYDGHMFDGEGNRREFSPGRYRVDAMTDWVLEYLETRTGEKPWFLMASYIEPHHQNDHGHYEGPRGSKDRFVDFPVPGDLADLDGDYREELPDYLGCCASLDENVGRIIVKLKELGEWENTLVIYASDHGSHFRTRNSEYKRSCHDGCIRIPMILCGGPFTGGAVNERLVSLIDIPATILTAADVEPPAVFRGNPLQQALQPDADWPDEVFLQISESQCGRAIRTSRWTYSVQDPDKDGFALNSAQYVEDCLYDLEADPFQKNNLASDPALSDVRAELAERLKRRMVQAGEAEPRILPASPS